MHLSNTLFYFTVVVFYLIEPLLGAFCQIPLGIFQLIVAWILKVDSKKLSKSFQSLINYYWISVLVWFVIVIATIYSAIIDNYFIPVLLVIPMIIGFYLVIVTHTSTKYYKL